MKLILLFISYSVICARYNYCFDVPKDVPTKYFDGSEWKTLKTRHDLRTKAPTPLDIISKEFDWADLINEMKEIELVQTATEVTSKNSVIKMAATPVPDTCGLKLTTPDMTIKKIENQKDVKNRWFLNAATETVNKDFARTRKPWPIIQPTQQLVSTNMPEKLCETQGDGRRAPENLPLVLMEFLEFLESKKCKPPCNPEAKISDNMYVLADSQRDPPLDEDLMNILMDGVEIDDSEDDYLTNDRMPSKETLEDQSQMLDLERDEGSKSVKIVKSSEIKAYFRALQDKHDKRENELLDDQRMKTSFDEVNYSQPRKEQDKDVGNQFKDNYLNGQNDADDLLDFSKDMLSTEDINEITDDSPEHADFTETNQTNDEDNNQDRDSTLEYIEDLENNLVGVDMYSNEKSSVQERK